MSMPALYIFYLSLYYIRLHLICIFLPTIPYQEAKLIECYPHTEENIAHVKDITVSKYQINSKALLVVLPCLLTPQNRTNIGNLVSDKSVVTDG